MHIMLLLYDTCSLKCSKLVHWMRTASRISGFFLLHGHAGGAWENRREIHCGMDSKK